MTRTPAPPQIGGARLKQTLGQAGLDDAFTDLTAELIGRFCNDVWRLTLDNGVRLIAKVPFRPTRSDEAADVERSFYRHMASRRDLPICRFIADLDGILLLEHHDLEPFSFREGVTGNHARAAIDTLADWHAAWWQRVPEANWLLNYADPAVRQAIETNYDQAWQVHGPRLLEFAPEFEALGNALVGRLADTLAAMAEPATLIHGDAHAENLPLTDKGVLLLDWQDPRIANPGLDLAVFTTMSYAEADRRSIERSLVDRHAARIRHQGCDWPDPWNDYRLGLLRRAARIVEIADVDFVSLPWVFRRSALAAIENDVGDLIC